VLILSGTVVKAWDLAVATMKVGEKSRYYCKDAYVYTDELVQSTDSTQQNCTVYDIELHSCQGFLYVFFVVVDPGVWGNASPTGTGIFCP